MLTEDELYNLQKEAERLKGIIANGEKIAHWNDHWSAVAVAAAKKKLAKVEKMLENHFWMKETIKKESKRWEGVDKQLYMDCVRGRCDCEDDEPCKIFSKG